MKHLTFTQAFDAKTLPQHNGKEGYSDDVLIDVDGNRKTFVIGWYDFDENKWEVPYFLKTSIDLKHMKWMYLPLAKYDNEK